MWVKLFKVTKLIRVIRVNCVFVLCCQRHSLSVNKKALSSNYKLCNKVTFFVQLPNLYVTFYYCWIKNLCESFKLCIFMTFILIINLLRIKPSHVWALPLIPPPPFRFHFWEAAQKWHTSLFEYIFNLIHMAIIPIDNIYYPNEIALLPPALISANHMACSNNLPIHCTFWFGI